MKLKTTFLIIAIGCAISVFGQTKFLFDASENPSVQRHIEEVNQKRADTTNIFSATPQSPGEIQERNGVAQHFPYPIIFIHGLVGSADTWTSFYNYALAQGWSYGGHIRFNLNSDNNLNYSNITLSSTSDVADFNSNLPDADFYLVNFNCGLDGTSYGGNYNTPTQSNQAAIVKQGLAIRQAVSHVLAATGKDKVILFGHSMGGLAARQYLQTPNLWQPDNKHHIAKLVTSGTPHGGSNASFPGFSAFAGVNERSDAVRDLRRTYFYSGSSGVFLFGGLESSSVMNDLLLGFYNYDVNCNGSIGNQITGLNQKNISTNLDFSCIVSDYSLDPLGGDLVVGWVEAQLKSYYNVVAETFEIDAFHTSMPGYTQINYESFDEPDYYDLAYTIEKNTDYNGFITRQAPDAEYSIDYDDFVFKTTQTGWVSVVVDNIVTYPFGVSILGHPNYNYLFDQTFQNGQIQTQAIQIPAGTYYLEFYAYGNSNSWQFPYAFRLVWSATNPTATSDIENKIKINISPNPTSGLIDIIIENEENTMGVMKIHTELGQEVHSKTFSGVKITEGFDLEAYPDGAYFISVTTERGSSTSKVIKKR